MGLLTEDGLVQAADQCYRSLHELHGPWRQRESSVESSSAAGLEAQIRFDLLPLRYTINSVGE